MEDSKKVPPQPKESSSPVDRIIELTPELEVISASRGKIIDLTQVLFSPGAPAPTPPKPIVARTASPFTAKVSRLKGIESDVDAAFDLIQSKAEEMRGPRVEPTTSEEDLKVSAPMPIGDWDDTLVGEPLIPEKARAVPAEAPMPDPPAEPGPAPIAAEIQAAAPSTQPKVSSIDELGADDALELTDIVRPVDLTPLDESAAAPAGKSTSAPASPQPVETLDEDPRSLLEAAIELDEEEEIIELTDIVSAEELAAARAAGEEEVIELTDVVSAEELAAAGYTPRGAMAAEAEAEEEEIIELTDIAAAEELAAAGYAAPATVAPEAEEEGEEEIIELVDRVEQPLPVERRAPMVSEPAQSPPDLLAEYALEVPTPADPADKDTEEMTMEVFADSPAPPKRAPESIKPESDQVIRLDSVLSQVRKQQEKISEDITMGIEEELAKEPIATGAKFSIGMAMEDVKEALGSTPSPTESEIEAAIEKVIRSKYGQTIEQMIATVVEKVVTREMDAIKRNLMEDQADSDEQ